MEPGISLSSILDAKGATLFPDVPYSLKMKKRFLPVLLLLFLSGCRDTAGAQHSNAKAGQKEWQPKAIAFSFDPDLVEVSNQVSFIRFKYEGPEYEMQDGVKFRLSVTNHGKPLIPEIQTSRHRGDLKIFIDGQRVMEMSLANMIFGDEQGIPKDSTDTFDIDLQITGPHTIGYGDVFTWQWEYAGIMSEIVKVDIRKKTTQVVNEHMKADKQLY